MQSVSITTKVVSSNPIHGEVVFYLQDSTAGQICDFVKYGGEE
jgi:hypothetical protein